MLIGCEKSSQIIDCQKASKDSYYNEYLDFELNLKVVSGFDEAIAHIDEHSSGHSEAIVSDDYSVCVGSGFCPAKDAQG